MSTQDNGGPAFPVLHTIDGNWVKEPEERYSGMTLRDYTAIQAMQAMLPTLKVSTEEELLTIAFPTTARFAYVMADAMLLERSK